jgi:hypothetical protein
VSGIDVVLLAMCIPLALGLSVGSSDDSHSDRTQSDGDWSKLRAIVAGGVTPEFQPSPHEFRQLVALGVRRLRLINIDSPRIHVVDDTILHIEWSPHLKEGLAACREYGFVPRIIIGQTLPPSLRVALGGGSDSARLWLLYRLYVKSTLEYVIGDWGFTESEWEVGNEMDLARENWVDALDHPTGDDAQRFVSYMTLYRHISTEIAAFRTRYPLTRIRVGGPAVTPGSFLARPVQTSWPARFIAAVTSPGQSAPVDFVSFHLYGNAASADETLKAIAVLREFMAARGVHLPMSASEWGPSWLATGAVNFGPGAGAFTLEFVHSMAAAGLDDAIFLALREFPTHRWPVLFDRADAPTHIMNALRLIHALQGVKVGCSTNDARMRCLAAMIRDTVRIVFWRSDWSIERISERAYRADHAFSELFLDSTMSMGDKSNMISLRLEMDGVSQAKPVLVTMTPSYPRRISLRLQQPLTGLYGFLVLN